MLGEEAVLTGGLTLKAPIKTAADDVHKYFFSLFFREIKI